MAFACCDKQISLLSLHVLQIWPSLFIVWNKLSVASSPTPPGWRKHQKSNPETEDLSESSEPLFGRESHFSSPGTD